MLLLRMVNGFGFALWQQLGGGNQAISPASVAVTLAMTWLGARGKTADEMRDVLELEGDRAAVAAAWGKLAAVLELDAGGQKLRLANRLFSSRDYPLDPEVVALVTGGFAAGIEPLAFSDPEAARGRITRWVAERTEDRIAELIGPGVLGADTKLVLANAIYFLGLWHMPFVKTATRDAPFWVAANRDKPVPMMHVTSRYRLARADDAAILELPYRGEQLAMYVVLPDARDGLPRLERRLDAESFAGWLRALRSEQVTVALPRFTISPESLRLDKLLIELGMKRAFSPRDADFSGMSQPADLYLSAVVHKAFVKVDEEGTVAAAATAAAMAPRGRPAPSITFTADHPFLFAIAERASGQVLFLGRVADP